MRAWMFIGAAFAAAVCSGLAEAQPGDRLELVDLTDDYERIWTETQTLPESQRVSHFKRAFAKIIPGFYDWKRMERYGATEQKYDDRLAKQLKEYLATRADIARVASEFQTRFTPALASFERAFGPMHGYPPVYLVNSHGEFDGGTRELPGGMRLMFGADMIGKIYKDIPIEPFFHHELFHLMHARTFSECEKVWCSLWSEGLAVYVAAQLNPKADDKALLLTFPVPLRAAVENHRSEAVCAVSARLHSEKGEDYAPLFSGGEKPLSANLPRRFGYYVGYLVAQDLGLTRSLKELAALKHAEALPLIEASLAKLATCPELKKKVGSERR